MGYCINCSKEYISFCPSCQVGLRYGNYQVIRPLSERSDYCLYEVCDLENNLGVMKVLRNGSTNEQLDQEEEILQSLRHPGIPTLYARFTVLSGRDCLVWSYSGGRNLEEMLTQEGPIPQSRALDWLNQLTEILQEVHEHNRKHLDIRPSNIIYGPDDQLVLQNFNPSGEVRFLDYTPREQATSENAVVQSDFFALGRTFIYLLTGKDLRELISNEGRILWRDRSSQISEPFAELIDSMAAPNVDDRPQNAQVILERINYLTLDSVESIPSSDERAELINAVAVSNVEAQPQTPQVTLPSTPNPVESIPSSNQQTGLIGAFGAKRGKTILGLVVGASVLLGLAFVWLSSTPKEPLAKLACDYAIDDGFSCGEESLFVSSRNLTKEKILGIHAFKNKQYKQAINNFIQARKKDLADSETLIYLNNARLEAELQSNEISNDKVLTIPVIVPIDGVDSALPEAILRGAAQYQDEFNKKGPNSLRLIIADDHSRPANAKHIAEKLVENSEVLGVVGHYASEVSQIGWEAYKNKLAFVSYGSTSQKLSCISDNPECKENIFFRTVPTTEITAVVLAKYLNDLSSDNKKQHIAVFYNPASLFSRDLAESFKSKLGDGKVVLQEDVCQTQFNVESILKQMGQQKVNIVALFPDGGICGSSRRNIISLVNEKRKRDEQSRTSSRETSILGSWSVLGADTLNDDGFMREAVKHLAVFSPWDPWTSKKDSESQEFLKNANKLWLSKKDAQMLRETAIFEHGIISGVTATTYDAMQALVTAIENSRKFSRPTREQVRKTLSSPNFSAKGVTGKISFNGSDRREEIGGLITVIPSCSNSKKYYIVPLNPKQLNCSSP
jgi:eukaryotic-like serine/threonine-protein kinase